MDDKLKALYRSVLKYHSVIVGQDKDRINERYVYVIFFEAPRGLGIFGGPPRITLGLKNE